LVFALKGQQCTLKVPGICTVRATEVHHVRGWRAGDDVRHLEPACQPCNLKLGDPTARASDPEPQPRTAW